MSVRDSVAFEFISNKISRTLTRKPYHKPCKDLLYENYSRLRACCSAWIGFIFICRKVDSKNITIV